MQLLDLIQGSTQWLEWRRKMITASDASSIMGLSPYKSIVDLYEEKLFPFEQEDNYYMARGRELEPVALEAFEKETGLIMFPSVVKHDSIEWLAASLDGMTIEQNAILEIKCNGKKNHALALKGEIPAYYRAQIMHQLACTGLEFSFYFSFNGEKGIVLEVKRDQEFIDIMLEKEFEFWQCLQTFTPPCKTIPKRRNKKYAADIVP